jgi:hypothetical protein
MADSAPMTLLPSNIPQSFFEGLEDVPIPQTTITSDLHVQKRTNSHVPTKAMLWYDAIVDDMLANPGTTLKACAARLGRTPVTIGYIVNSDLFKVRYAQRRDRFNEELNTRLTGKLAQVAEKSLDFTLEALDKKRDAVPLPLLHEISDMALSRLGYGPKGSAPASPTVIVQQNNSGPAAQVATPVSREALAEARRNLKVVEGLRAAASGVTEHQPAPLPAAGGEEEEQG